MSDDKAAADKQANVNPAELPIPAELPVLPLNDFVFFPGMGFPLQVSNEHSRQLIDDALMHDRLIAVVSHKKIAENEPSKELSDNLYSIGVVCYIHKLIKSPEGFYQVVMSAVKKIRILEYTVREPYLKAKIEVIDMRVQEDKEVEAHVLNLRNQFKKLVTLSQLPTELYMTVAAITDPFHIAYLVASQLNLSLGEEQAILEIVDLKEMLRKVAEELAKRLETVEMSNQIQKAVKEDMDDKQREFFLRQQLKAIRKELGEDDEHADINDLRLRVAEAKLGDEPRKAAEKELGRLTKIPSSSPEYTVSRTYLEWILDLPWEISTTDSLDLEEAQRILDQDHYGLEKIKKRIIEFLAVRKLKHDMHGPILCFVGPPGVGKTSLGQSIARALGRKFVRISLGGVRDEAEIRGHRRTYIGALPGRIIQSLRKSGSNNPLFMLDEIDKLGMDFRGDPSSALLEVLDPEQNFSFADHYLEIPFDLSKVMFITTANILDTIPGPLRDRMEVIRLPGYTLQEKVQIARRYLVPKAITEHGLKRTQIKFTPLVLEAIIGGYTAEAGVRNLERQIANVCRKVARGFAEGKTRPVEVTLRKLKNFLGPIKIEKDVAENKALPGVVTGLAWTPYGGDILFIEATRMAGKGGLILTGSLGDVMKESARASLSYLKANAETFKIDPELFAKSDLHIHVP